MRCHWLQHVPFEGLGSIKTWLDSAGYKVSSTRLYESSDFPDLKAFDLLVIMGGPMSVNDEAELPWLIEEKAFIREAITAGKAILGVCLGAQLIANTLGAKLHRNPVKEIGWFPIRAVAHADPGLFVFPPLLEVFHWHGETFDLPDGAELLAASAGCRHQAFQLGRSVIGLQFHLETTPASALEIVTNCRAELVPSQHVQSEQEILEAAPERYGAINEVMGQMLSFLQSAGRR